VGGQKSVCSISKKRRSIRKLKEMRQNKTSSSAKKKGGNELNIDGTLKRRRRKKNKNYNKDQFSISVWRVSLLLAFFGDIRCVYANLRFISHTECTL
jgi:hypothetical protein